MKKIFLTVLICLGLLAPAYAGVVVDVPLKTDLVGKRVLETGAIKRVSAATYIHDGVLATADGDDTPFSHTSVEDETGAANMLGSFTDDQAWFHDSGGLIAVYAGTGNLLIVTDGTYFGYGFLGEIGTGIVNTALANNVTGITKADPGVVSSVAHGLVVGDLVYFDSLTQMTELNTTWKNVTAVGSADLFSINDTSGYGAAETTGGACAHETTETSANGVHIYKEYSLTNEGWNSYDTGIDFNAGASWDFDIYTNLMTATGSTAQARFEDEWLLFEPEGTNLITYSEDFSQWTATEVTLDTSEADPRGGTGATGLVGSVVAGNHYLYLPITVPDNANITYSIFAKAGAQEWIRITIVTKENVWSKCYFQLSGAGTVGTNTTTKESIERLGTTDWYRCRITHSVATGATAPYVYIYLAEADNDTEFTGDGTTIDTYVYGADAKQDLFLTSYIPTNGIPVTRTTEAGSAADNGVSWTTPQALKNILDDAEPGGGATDSQGTLTFEVKWGCDESDIAVGNYGLVGATNAPLSVGGFNDGTFFSWDGASSSAVTHPAFSAGDEITYASRWGTVDGNADDLSAGLKYGGAWSFDVTPPDYDGEFTLGTKVRLGYGCLYPFHIRNIKFYDIPYSQAQVEAGIEAGVIKWMIPLEFP